MAGGVMFLAFALLLSSGFAAAAPCGTRRQTQTLSRSPEVKKETEALLVFCNSFGLLQSDDGSYTPGLPAFAARSVTTANPACVVRPADEFGRPEALLCVNGAADVERASGRGINSCTCSVGGGEGSERVSVTCQGDSITGPFGPGAMTETSRSETIYPINPRTKSCDLQGSRIKNGKRVALPELEHFVYEVSSWDCENKPKMSLVLDFYGLGIGETFLKPRETFKQVSFCPETRDFYEEGIKSKGQNGLLPGWPADSSSWTTAVDRLTLINPGNVRVDLSSKFLRLTHLGIVDADTALVYSGGDEKSELFKLLKANAQTLQSLDLSGNKFESLQQAIGSIASFPALKQINFAGSFETATPKTFSSGLIKLKDKFPVLEFINFNTYRTRAFAAKSRQTVRSDMMWPHNFFEGVQVTFAMDKKDAKLFALTAVDTDLGRDQDVFCTLHSAVAAQVSASGGAEGSVTDPVMGVVTRWRAAVAEPPSGIQSQTWLPAPVIQEVAWCENKAPGWLNADETAAQEAQAARAAMAQIQEQERIAADLERQARELEKEALSAERVKALRLLAAQAEANATAAALERSTVVLWCSMLPGSGLMQLASPTAFTRATPDKAPVPFTNARLQESFLLAPESPLVKRAGDITRLEFWSGTFDTLPANFFKTGHTLRFPKLTSVFFYDCPNFEWSDTADWLKEAVGGTSGFRENLIELKLQGTKTSGSGMDLTNYGKLQALDIIGASPKYSFGEETRKLDAFPAFCPPSLTVLRLSGQKLSNTGLATIKNCVNLQVLDLSNNRAGKNCASSTSFSDIGASFAGENGKVLAKLRELDVSDNCVTRLARASFDPLLELKAVYLKNNMISTIELNTFKKNEKLTILHLQGNPQLKSYPCHFWKAFNRGQWLSEVSKWRVDMPIDLLIGKDRVLDQNSRVIPQTKQDSEDCPANTDLKYLGFKNVVCEDFQVPGTPGDRNSGTRCPSELPPGQANAYRFASSAPAVSVGLRRQHHHEK